MAKRVLFDCEHISGIASIIAIRAHFHSDDYAVLMVGYESDFMKKLAATGVFAKIIYPISGLFKDIRHLSADEQEKKISSLYQVRLAEAGVDLDEFDTIYTASEVENLFGVYLSLCQRKFIHIEIMTALLISLYADDAMRDIRAIQEKYDVLYGTKNRYVTRCLRVQGSHNKPEITDKCEWFDFMKLFTTMPERYKKMITAVFGLDTAPLSDKDACLILPNSTEFGGTPLYQRNMLYTTIMDYYADANAKVYVKEHPNTNKDMLLDRQHLDITAMDNSTPFEFYMLDDGLVINKTITIVSTASEKLASNTKEVIYLGFSYFTQFIYCHKIYFAFKLLEALGASNRHCHIKALDTDFLAKFLHYCLGYEYPNHNIGEDANLGGGNVLIADYLSEDVLSATEHDTIVILLQAHNFQEELAQYVLPICITKQAIGDYYTDSLNAEVFYIFCKSAQIREQVRGFVLENKLYYTGLVTRAYAVPLAELAKALKHAQPFDLRRWVKSILNRLSKQNRSKTRNSYPKWLIHMLCWFVPSKRNRYTIRQHYIKKDYGDIYGY